ncbi:MAG: hypothetical protein PWQ22_266 [Archaeoglobaceae archaeon]|nr:hypothetical protein [Archaeoglobaceae archaeon]
MKKFFGVFILTLLIAFIPAAAVPAKPDPFELKQPDDTTFMANLWVMREQLFTKR